MDIKEFLNLDSKEWYPFPNPRKGEYLNAPFGSGVYLLWDEKAEKYVLFGSGKHLAYRMTSLLPAPLGAGTRRNEEKRNYVLKNLKDIKYRTAAFVDNNKAKVFEKEIKEYFKKEENKEKCIYRD